MAKLIGTIGATEKVLRSKKLGTKYWLKRFNLSIFAMNAVDVWLAYQGITRTAEIQADFYNYLAEEMIQRVKLRRRTIVDSDDDYVDDKNPLFGRINGAPRCGIALHVTPH